MLTQLSFIRLGREYSARANPHRRPSIVFAHRCPPSLAQAPIDALRQGLERTVAVSDIWWISFGLLQIESSGPSPHDWRIWRSVPQAGPLRYLRCSANWQMTDAELWSTRARTCLRRPSRYTFPISPSPTACARSAGTVALVWHSTAPSFHPVSKLLSSRKSRAVPSPRDATRVVATSV